MPTFNSEKYLVETLESVFAQTFTDWELIVTEDGSCDSTADIVRSFAHRISQPVLYTRHEHSQGPNAARNTGILRARADWIALLDSDDIWLPNHLETCIQTARVTGADLIHSGSILFNSETGIDISVRAPSEKAIARLPFTLFESSYIIQPSSVILSRTLWDKVGHFDPLLRYAEDLDMWIRCYRIGGKFAYTGRETCRYRKHAISPSTNSAAMAEGTARAFEKHLNWSALPQNFRQLICAQAWATSARLQWRSQPMIANAYFRRACSLHWNPRWFLQGILCRCMAVFDITLAI